MIRKCVQIVGLLSISLMLCTRETSAHRDDYLNETLVYLTVEPNELEAEYWFDRGRPSDGNGYFSRHNTALEWGLTSHWMMDGRLTITSRAGQATVFESARLESRYRFSDEGVLPIDLAASFETNSERESDGTTTVGLEPRLILSKDLGEKLNFTINCSEEIPLDSGSPAFLLACGSRFNWTKLARVGSEFQYDFKERAGQVIPQLWLAFPRGVTVKTGYSIGIDANPTDFVRLALEVEF